MILALYFQRLTGAVSICCGLMTAFWPVAGLAQDDLQAGGEGYIETFDDISFRDRWFIAHFDQERESFVTSWRRQAVSVSIPAADLAGGGGGAAILRLYPANWGMPKPFVGAQLQGPGKTHYGSYEVYMQPARGSGLVSSMFTYTGPHFGDPHEEIDFEFLGRDTTKVWINQFVDGETMPGQWFDLRFDAAAEPHLYRFDWTEDSITWYVDDRELHRITSDTHAIPSTPGKLMIDIWAGNKNQREWLGRVSPDLNGEARYYCVSYRPFGSTGQTCADYVAQE